MMNAAATLSATLRARQDELAREVVDEHYREAPELAERYGAEGRHRCLEDARYHLQYLAEAAASERPSFFAHYVDWARVVLTNRGVPAADLEHNLAVLERVLERRLEPAPAELAGRWIADARELLATRKGDPPSPLAGDDELAHLARSYLDALLAGLRGAARDLVVGAVDRGTSIKDVYLRVFQPCQREIGRLWQLGRITVAQEHYVTAATQLIMSMLYPRLFAGERNGRTLIACCVSGELHEVGLRMVADFFELEGWDTHFLGAATPAAGVLEMAREQSADVLAISATMIPHVSQVERMIDATRRDPDLAGLKVMVGGYPFNLEPELWRQLGADGWANDARQAIRLAEDLIDEAAPARP